MAGLTEQASAYKIISTIAAQTLTSSDVNGAGIDLQGFGSAFISVNVGANGGTLNGSNKLDLKLEHSDDDSTYTAVTDLGEAGGYTVDNSGIFATIDAGGEAAMTYKTAYTGIKRYIRVVADVTGTISLPVSVVALLGDGLKPQA